MLSLSNIPGRACLAVCLLGGVAVSARAADHVTLKNGFDLVCDHQQTQGQYVRLFLGKSSGNFVDVDAAEIASSESVPDLPVPTPVTAVQVPPVLDAAALHQMVSKAGGEHNLDIDLLESVIRAESGGNIRAVSRTGARGLMQLMPGTAEQLGVADSFAADQNINGGTAYLNGLLERYHDDLPLALAAYNAGPAAVDKYHGIPPYRETRSYVARVIHEFNRRKREINRRKALAAAEARTAQTATAAAPMAANAVRE
ncbi:MAG: lytic transglycosylase domain-containing protein [Acidobacteriaceae bacterium]